MPPLFDLLSLVHSKSPPRYILLFGLPAPEINHVMIMLVQQNMPFHNQFYREFSLTFKSQDWARAHRLVTCLIMLSRNESSGRDMTICHANNQRLMKHMFFVNKQSVSHDHLLLKQAVKNVPHGRSRLASSHSTRQHLPLSQLSQPAKK